MPPRKVTLRYYAALPIVDEPEYKDGYHCDYCREYFSTGPFYHCPSTGTDGCIACVENKGQKSAKPSRSNAPQTTTLPTLVAFPGAVSLIALPSRELFEESGAALQSIAGNFRTATSSSMTNDLFLAATEKSRLIMGYMLQSNVMGALFSTGASLLVVLDNAGGMGPACLAVPGNDAVTSCMRALNESVPSPSVYNTIVPVLTDQLHALFPWVSKLRTALATSTIRPFSSFHRPMEAFVASPGAWPPFIQLCSASSSNLRETNGSYLGFITSEGLLQVVSFVGLHEWQCTCGAVEGTNESNQQRIWGPDGELGRVAPYTAIESTREWAAEWLRAAATTPSE